MNKTYRIKSLEWERGGSGSYYTTTPWVWGNITMVTNWWCWELGWLCGRCRTLKKAKAECEQIYLSRTREGLEVVE